MSLIITRLIHLAPLPVQYEALRAYKEEGVLLEMLVRGGSRGRVGGSIGGV